MSGVALIFADGGVPARELLDTTWPRWADDIRIHIAADGGARSAATFGIRLDYWVGDGDSIDAASLDRLAREGVVIQRAAPDKDESDTELALLTALEHGADAVVILGALGGMRFDHALANIGLMRHPALEGRSVRLYDEVASRISLIGSPEDHGVPVTVDFEGRRGDLVSLLPLDHAAEGVRTEGLEFELRDEVLAGGRTRGLSNVRTGEMARITLRAGRLLVIETPVTVRP